MKFYGLSNDYMFKALMQEREDVLRNLISALLGIDESEVVSCVITNPIILGETVEDKDCILDVRLVLNRDKNINIELQIRKEGYWSDRSLLYWAREYDDLKAGEEYSLLKPTYHIGIIDFPLYEGDDEFFSEYKIMNIRNHRVYSDKFIIKVLNLSNIDIPGGADDKVVHWAKIFKAKTIKELEELAGEQEVFKHMVLELRKLSADEKIKQQLEARADYESRLATERGVGRREGITEGVSLLEKAILYVKQGQSLEEIVKKGISEDIAKRAISIIGK